MGCPWAACLGLMTDVFSFSAAISACEKGGQWEQILLLLHWQNIPFLLDHQCLPAPITANAAEFVCNAREALLAVREMMIFTAFDDDEHKCSMMYEVQCIMYHVRCILYDVCCILYTVYCILYTV